MKNLHYLVRTARLERGLSQREVASAVGAKQPQISMYESGDATALGAEKTLKLFQHLDIDVSPSDVRRGGRATSNWSWDAQDQTVTLFETNAATFPLWRVVP